MNPKEFEKSFAHVGLPSSFEGALELLGQFCDEPASSPNLRVSSVDLLPRLRGVVAAIGLVALQGVMVGERRFLASPDGEYQMALQVVDNPTNDVALHFVDVSGAVHAPQAAAMLPSQKSLEQLEQTREAPALEWSRDDLRSATSQRGQRGLRAFIPFQQPKFGGVRITDWEPRPSDPEYLQLPNANATGYLRESALVVGLLVDLIRDRHLDES